MQNSLVDSPDLNSELNPVKSNLFGGNTPVSIRPAIDADAKTKKVLPDIAARDAHRSPAAHRARQNVRGLIEGARRDRRKRARPASDVVIATQIVRSYYADWLGDCDYNGQSPLTLDGKRIATEKLIWFLERERIEQCGEDEIRDFLSHVEHGHEEEDGRYGARTQRSYRPIGTRTLQVYFQCIRTYFKWLVAEQLVPANPLEKSEQPKHTYREIAPLSMDEIEALLRAIPRGLNRARNAAALYLIFDTGLRVSEMCSIRVADIDLARRHVDVIGKFDKKRQVYFSGDTAKMIRVYLTSHPRGADEMLFYSERAGSFSEGMTPDGFRRTLKRLAQAAGLDPARVSPHKLRHSFATEFLRAGGNARALQLMLGHEDMKMTDRYVTLVDADAEKEHRDHSPIRSMKARKR